MSTFKQKSPFPARRVKLQFAHDRHGEPVEKETIGVWIPAEPRELSLSPKQALIVQILARHKEPMTGYAIAKASKGELTVTGVYVQLDSLETKNIITSDFEEVAEGSRRLPKRFVRLTRGTFHLKGKMHEHAETDAPTIRSTTLAPS